SRLYTLPAVALEVLRLTDDPGVDTLTLKSALEYDPALTSKVLRAINSPLFGLPQPVSSLGDAVTLLGIKPLKLLVLGFSLPPRLNGKVENEFLSGYWRRALTKAIAAREIAAAWAPASSEDAFLAGLLADVGMLALAQALGRPYAEVVARVRAAGRSLPDVERHTLGFDHLQLTVHVLARWGLPPAMVKAISLAAEGPAPGDKPLDPDANLPLTTILRLAELTTALLVEEQLHLLPTLLGEADDAGVFTALEVTSLVSTLELKVSQLAGALGLVKAGDFDFEKMLAEAQARLADITPDAAAALAVVESRTRTGVEQTSSWRETRLLAQIADRVRCGSLQLADRAEVQRAAVVEKAEAAPRSPLDSELWATGASGPLMERMTAAIAVCRQARSPLSVLLVRTDAPRLPPSSGRNGCHPPQNSVDLPQFCGQLDFPHKLYLQLDERCHAILLLHCERSQLVSLGQELLRRVRGLHPPGQLPAFSISIGAAAAPVLSANFSAQRLFDGAYRCLYAAAVSGNTLK
ncbi:MAG TPA: HDOD domain-containing protein, partial [Pirellulales bacterium]|nr:HDOD domain-containing protein [Pirellulales bacterium]